MMELHGPVPHYAEDLHASMGGSNGPSMAGTGRETEDRREKAMLLRSVGWHTLQALENIKVQSELVSVNSSMPAELEPTICHFVQGRVFASLRKPDPSMTPEAILARVFLKVEYETLRRLPVNSECPALASMPLACEGLASEIRRLPEEAPVTPIRRTANYETQLAKSTPKPRTMPEVRAVVLSYLDSASAASEGSSQLEPPFSLPAMYGLRGITNLYEGGTRSDYIVVAHPEFALGKVGSGRGFGAKWDLSKVPHELAGGPAAARLRRAGSAQLLQRITVPLQTLPSPQERAVAKKAQRGARGAPGERSQAPGLGKNFNVFLAALSSLVDDGESSHFRRTRMEDVQGRELGCDGRLTSGYFNNILEAGVASHRKEMQGSLLELARRYKRDPEAVEHELLKSGSWRFWASELETVCGQRTRLATKQRARAARTAWAEEALGLSEEPAEQATVARTQAIEPFEFKVLREGGRQIVSDKLWVIVVCINVTYHVNWCGVDASDALEAGSVHSMILKKCCRHVTCYNLMVTLMIFVWHLAALLAQPETPGSKRWSDATLPSPGRFLHAGVAVEAYTFFQNYNGDYRLHSPVHAEYPDSLHLGVFSGSIELENLKVRPDALAILGPLSGWEGFRVHSGSIERISLSIPWTRLYTGLEVESLAESAHGKSEAELIKEMRDAKEKAIDVRMQQLQDLVDRSKDSDDENAVSDNASLGMNLARKILNNITVVLEDLPNLAVLSTDKTFRERDDSEGAVVPGESMYKTLQMKADFSVRMSPAGTKDLQAAYVLSPVSANLQLSHEPANNLLKIKLMVATEELAEVFLRRSQVKHLRSIKSDLNEEARKFHLMLVPEADQKEINQVLNEEVVRRKREQEESRVAEQRKKTGLLGRFWGRQESEDEVEAPETALLSSEEKDQLLTDLKDVSKVEQVDVPKRFSFEFVLGQMALDLIDDQHQDEVRRQLMSLALREDINMATDFRGRDSAEWGMKIDLRPGSFKGFDIQSKLQKEQNLLDISFKSLSGDVRSGRLTQTTLRATSLRHEQFDMIQPVPVDVTIEYRDISADEMRLSLSPQALQILLATPTGLMSVMKLSRILRGSRYVSEAQEAPKTSRRESFVWLAASHVFTATSQADIADDVTSEAACLVPSATEPAAWARGVLLLHGGPGSQGTKAKLKASCHWLQQVEQATKQMEEVRAKQFIFNLSVNLEAVDMVLADSIVPVLRCRAELPKPGLVMYKQKEPNILTNHIQDFTLELRFRMGLEVERHMHGEDRDINVIVSGHEPVLVKRLKYITPLFIESVTSSDLLGAGEEEREGEEGHGARVVHAHAEQHQDHHVVNLFGSAIKLHFRSRYAKNVMALVKPSVDLIGGLQVKMRRWVLPHFATAVTAQDDKKSPKSEWLSLERSGAVTIPAVGCVAETWPV
ncbi:hypothetical protein AK812_SmicGene1702 [Symbiodinium microadriaticum]|uniref:Uncharacterized protein n=1 Tax=Symbiodinium microadriaticum TaxID=2951 RepID=A0A1Q9F3H2_SYMMI|nr:hypothetical protein AK812_SmicGene1702 [Symbiodinium microadriaticum]